MTGPPPPGGFPLGCVPTTIEFDGPMNTGEGMKRVQQFAFSRISGFYSIPEGTGIQMVFFFGLLDPAQSLRRRKGSL